MLLFTRLASVDGGGEPGFDHCFVCNSKRPDRDTSGSGTAAGLDASVSPGAGGAGAGAGAGASAGAGSTKHREDTAPKKKALHLVAR